MYPLREDVFFQLHELPRGHSAQKLDNLARIARVHTEERGDSEAVFLILTRHHLPVEEHRAAL